MKRHRIGYEFLLVNDSDEKYLTGNSPLEVVITRERTESFIYTETYKITANNLADAMRQINEGDVEPSERETDEDTDYSEYVLVEVTESEEEPAEDDSPLPGQIDLFGNIVE